ncbi:hypothetical protein MRY82_10575 [bacterium]|nr:hypothetical protein [bacterium]
MMPEYSPLKRLVLPLKNSVRSGSDFPGEAIWQQFLSRIAFVAHKKNIELSLLLKVDTMEHCHPENQELESEYKALYPLVQGFEQSLNKTCSLNEQDNCLATVRYRCVSKNYAWLRNNSYLEAKDRQQNKIYVQMQGQNPILKHDLLSNTDSLVSIPLRWNGPADILTDKEQGHLYITQRMLDSNKKTPAELETHLRSYLNFDRLVVLKANPWEFTQDTDTIVMFAKHPKTRKVHAFLSKQPDIFIRRAFHNNEPITTDFLTLATALRSEINDCIKSKDHKYIALFAFGQWNDPFEFINQNNWVSNLSGHDSQQAFLNQAHELFPNFPQIMRCLQDFANKKHQQAQAADAFNFEALKQAGYPESRIHWLEAAGMYSNFYDNAGSYMASYINGIVLDDTYLMPSFPSFDQPDTYSNRTSLEIVKAFEQLGQQDLKAIEHLKPWFKEVVPVRSDFLPGGALHCSSTCFFNP